MDQKNSSLNEHSMEFFLKSRDKLIHSYSVMSNTINTFSDDEEKSLVFAIDNSLTFHSIKISDNIFNMNGKKEIIDRITKLINRAIIKSGINGAKEAKNVFSSKEFSEIISNENQEIKESINKIQEKIMRSFKQLSLITKTIVSDSGNISIVISGDKMVKSISICDEYLSSKKRSIFEKELLGSLNTAIQEIQKEIEILFNKNEEEIYKTLIHE
jgi:DNA-binding protein YbaB